MNIEHPAMNGKMKKQRLETVKQGPPEIIKDRCVGCALCADNCPVFVLEVLNDIAEVVRPEFCIKCGHCGSVCPEKAIRQTSTESEDSPSPGLGALPSPDSLQQLFRARRSIRRYQAKGITREDMERIIEAGRFTATGSNAQNVCYIVLTDRDEIAKLREMTLPVLVKAFRNLARMTSFPFFSNMVGEGLAGRIQNLYKPAVQILIERWNRGEDRLFYNAPAIIVVYGDKWDDTAGFACCAALYNCSLMAHTLGLGCCFMGFLGIAVNKDAGIRKWLGIPKSQKFYGAMTLGYPDVKYNRLVKRNPATVTWR